MQPEATEKNCEKKIKQIIEIIKPILNRVDCPSDDEIELSERIYTILNKAKK